MESQDERERSPRHAQHAITEQGQELAPVTSEQIQVDGTPSAPAASGSADVATSGVPVPVSVPGSAPVSGSAAASNDQTPAQPQGERRTPFHAFLDLIMPLLPPPSTNGQPPPPPHPAAAAAGANEPNASGAPADGPDAPPPRDGIIIFFNFGPSNPATSSNPAKAKEMLESLPAVDVCTLKRVDAVVRAESGADEGWSCGICLEGEGSVTALPCNHLFHRDCLEPWFASHLTCPTCRMQLDPLNTLSNHDTPATPSGSQPQRMRTRTSTMRPPASGSNTPSARSTPYPPRTPTEAPQGQMPPAATIIFGGPFNSSPVPLNPDAAATAQAQPQTQVQPDAGTSEQAQTDTPPINMPPFSFFFPAPAHDGPGTPMLDGGNGESEENAHPPRFFFFGEPPAGNGHDQVQPAAPTQFPFPSTAADAPPDQMGVNAARPTPATGANAEAALPPMPTPTDMPRFRFGFHAHRPPPTPPSSEPAAPPRKTITLDQWLHARERTLGWRCDGPICGLAPSEDDLELAGAPETTEETCAIYSTSQPFFRPPPSGTPPRAEDFTIMACAHRWHRSCLEIAARSGGYWRVEGERIWVRCMACRHEGWIHTDFDTAAAEVEAEAIEMACT